VIVFLKKSLTVIGCWSRVQCDWMEMMRRGRARGIATTLLVLMLAASRMSLVDLCCLIYYSTIFCNIAVMQRIKGWG
jgi:hypothetical protein